MLALSLVALVGCSAEAGAVAGGVAGAEPNRLPEAGRVAVAAIGGGAAAGVAPSSAGRAAESVAAGGGGRAGQLAAAVGGTVAAGSGGMVAGGAAAAPPIARDGLYVLAAGGLELVVDPKLGGRVVRFALDGQNVLTGAEVDSTNWGSTFWPSPQTSWNWPPVPELDSQPYKVEIVGDTLSLTSEPGMRARVRVSKRFRVLPAASGVEVTYTLENTDSMPASWAPWEISRVAAAGLTFFPRGKSSASTQLPLIEQGGALWYRHDPAQIMGSGQKWSGDGSEGFIAHVAGQLLFVKAFADLQPEQQAPAPEGEVAVYAAPGYVELEPQGPYASLAPGARTEWSVRWYLRELPQDLAIEVGSAALLELARGTTRP
ncbi:MAG: hypothetical protein ABW321_14575 [Polyangiales bacterium]